MNQKYIIELNDEERQYLEKITSSGIAPARMVKRAQILLKSDCKGEGTAHPETWQSWLNMAEIELSALVRQCLDRRIPDKETINKEVKAWQDQRNSAVVKVHWQFTTADARVKLKSLYPKIEV